MSLLTATMQKFSQQRILPRNAAVKPLDRAQVNLELADGKPSRPRQCLNLSRKSPQGFKARRAHPARLVNGQTRFGRKHVEPLLTPGHAQELSREGIRGRLVVRLHGLEAILP